MFLRWDGDDTSNASQIVRQSDSHVEVLRLGLREAVDTRDVVLDGERNLSREALSIGRHVEITGVRPSSIGVDLVDSHLNLAALGDLSDTLGLESVLGLFADVDVALELSAAALVDDVSLDLGRTDEGGVLLAGVDGGAVSCDGRVDCKEFSKVVVKIMTETVNED